MSNAVSARRRSLVRQPPAAHPGSAVESPKLSALWAAAARALGTHDPDPSVRNPDWLAEHFLGAAERARLGDNPIVTALERGTGEPIHETESAIRYMLQRTRFIDDHLHQMIAAGAVQVVVLGSGLDSRPYRLRSLLHRVTVFELDHYSTQALKRQRVRQVLGGPPRNVVYGAIDFSRESLGECLARLGFRNDRVSCFIWEGVSMYLPEEAVRTTLGAIALMSAPRSSVVFDYWTRAHVEEGSTRDEMLRGRFGMAQRWGEPVLFGIPQGTEASFLENCGLRLVEQLPFHGDDMVQRYLVRRDGTRVCDVTTSSQASIPSSPGTWMAVAVVPSVGHSHDTPTPQQRLVGYQLRADLRHRIGNKFKRDLTDVQDTSSLVRAGILDLLRVSQLVALVEQQYGIIVRNEDRRPDDFDSIAAIAAFIERQQS